ncbi:hypothetical protein SAMN04515620_11922 [Collimonas sp. OK607]|uniref:hypothetical protein n=1 Tax=Collimonas sp. OK607 TaxID=1798194 RepID=UPI0008EEC821|nr:hypothetical protein [Collimonas sp. OK607]SFB11974.1 hypothetical protein SAMN04515620_11922 [Collimonas sp. OK607]
MQDVTAGESRRLLCVLFVRFGEVSTDSAAAWVLRIAEPLNGLRNLNCDVAFVPTPLEFITNRHVTLATEAYAAALIYSIFVSDNSDHQNFRI